MILQSDGVSATCLSGPSFTTTEANNAQGGAAEHVLSGARVHAARRVDQGLGAPGTGPISQASRSHSSRPTAGSRVRSCRGRSPPT